MEFDGFESSDCVREVMMASKGFEDGLMGMALILALDGIVMRLERSKK